LRPSTNAKHQPADSSALSAHRQVHQSARVAGSSAASRAKHGEGRAVRFQRRREIPLRRQPNSPILINSPTGQCCHSALPGSCAASRSTMASDARYEASAAARFPCAFSRSRSLVADRQIQVPGVVARLLGDEPHNDVQRRTVRLSAPPAGSLASLERHPPCYGSLKGSRCQSPLPSSSATSSSWMVTDIPVRPQRCLQISPANSTSPRCRELIDRSWWQAALPSSSRTSRLRMASEVRYASSALADSPAPSIPYPHVPTHRRFAIPVTLRSRANLNQPLMVPPQPAMWTFPAPVNQILQRSEIVRPHRHRSFLRKHAVNSVHQPSENLSRLRLLQTRHIPQPCYPLHPTRHRVIGQPRVAPFSSPSVSSPPYTAAAPERSFRGIRWTCAPSRATGRTATNSHRCAAIAACSALSET